MRKKIRKHIKRIIFQKKPPQKEVLHPHAGNVPLNIVLQDRISFSVLRSESNHIKKIENISYEINIDGKWE